MDPICVRIILTGDAGVGKTALIQRYIHGTFVPSNYRPTLSMDVEERRIVVDGKEVLLQVWDTVGQERFRGAIPPLFFRQSNACVFVFDVTRSETLDSWDQWSETVRSHLDEKQFEAMPFVAMANKIDLTNVQRLDLHKTIWEQAMGGIKCYRTSAKDDHCNVDEIFEEIARDALAQMAVDESDAPDVPPDSKPTQLKLTSVKPKKSCC